MKYQLSTRFQKEVLHITKYPEASARELLLENRQTEFRSKCVGKYNKAIYYIKGDTIYFTDLWDMRRDPDRLVKRIKKK